ncbi:MAG: HDOD domain-containing protein [Nitrospiraceae bacterium]|nr:HDOD domain-containing protein [Nitrospiraceae bacterium]
MDRAKLICPFCAGDAPLERHTHRGHRGDGLRACPECLNPFVVQNQSGSLRADPLPGTEDIRVTVPEGSVMAGVLGALPSALEELPVLPEVPQRILAMIHDPLVCMRGLADLMAEDAVISSKILKIANSAYYATVDEIHDLQIACAYLGLRTIANAVHAIMNGNLYRSSDPTCHDIMQSLWRHSVATAHCADELGTRWWHDGDSLLFQAGLSHDIGKLVLFDLITVRYRGRVGRLRENPALLLQALGRHHALVGLHVAQHWALDPLPRAAVFFHHAPGTAPTAEGRRYADAVALASAVAHGMEESAEDEERPNPAEHPAAARLGIPPEEVHTLSEAVHDKVESMIDLFAA